MTLVGGAVNEAATEPREGAVDVAHFEQRQRFPPDRLGTLGPRAVWLAGALFWALVLLALVQQFAEIQRWRDKIETLDPLFADYGMVLLDEDLLFEVAPATQAAYKAGIRRGDTILAVNGEEYSVYTGEMALYAMTAPQVARLIRDAGTDPITFAVQNDKEAAAEAADKAAGVDTEDKQYWRLIDLKRSPSAANLSSVPVELARRWVLKGIKWTIAALLLLSAIYLWWKKRRELVNVAVACAMAIYGGGVGSEPLFDEISFILSGLLRLVSTLGVGLFIMTLPALPDGRYRPVAARWIMLGGLVVIGTGVLAQGLAMVPWKYFRGIEDAYWAIQGALSLVQYRGGLVLLLLAIALALFKFLRTPKGPERQQVKLIAFGLIAGFLALAAIYVRNFLLSLVPQHSLAWIVIYDMGAVLLDSAPLFIALGVVGSQMRYRLNDADSFISRTAAYGVVTAVITTVWGSLTTWTTGALAAIGGAESASAISAVLAAAVFVPVRKRVLDWTEAKFQPALVRMRSLPAKIRSLAHDHDPAEIARAALVATVKGVGARHGAIALAEGEGHKVIAADTVAPDDVAAFLAGSAEHDRNGAEGRHGSEGGDGLAFPVRIDLSDLVGPVGVLLIGPRSDGASYSSDEKEALGMICGPLAEALRATSRRARRNGAIAEALASLEARIGQVETRQVR